LNAKQGRTYAATIGRGGGGL